MKWLGAILMIGSCSAIGLLLTGEMKRKLRLLQALTALVQTLKNEILQRSAPLTYILNQEAEIPSLLTETERAISQSIQKGIPLEAAAAKPLERLQATEDLPDAAQTMRQLCSVLGKYDGQTQGEACSRALFELEAQTDALQRQLAEKGKVYRSVSISAGIVLTLAVL